jgi:hypothetical protein
MIQGFEKQTQPLSEYEQKTLLPVLVRGLRERVGKARRISSSAIIQGMNAAGYKLGGPRLRKIINHIRTNDLLVGLVSNGQGYFVATTASEIDECIASLQGRVDATQAIIRALQRQRQIKF